MTTPTGTTYSDRAIIANDATFKNRVKVAMMTAAVTTGFQPKAVDEADWFYKKRISFCILIIYGDPVNYLNAFTWGLIWDSSSIPGMVDIFAVYNDTSSTGDALLQNAVNAIFEFMIKAP